MSTAFFENQDEARRNTRRLIVLFLLAVVILIVLNYALVLFVFRCENGDQFITAGWWHPMILLGAAASTLLVVGLGSVYKVSQLASGGKAVALMLGGREISPTTRDFHEKRLLNIVEEMAIASGVPVPPVYLLPEELGINAFAAGHSTSDGVVAVSQGAINFLTRDELQGVVAHEFSHILNGDMRLNIRLMGLIFGIVVVSLIGWYLMMLQNRPRSSDSKNSGGQLFLLGLGLYILGVAGAFLGQMIQAAISRQREFLADASAVQFTRNPDGIAGALKKIGGLAEGSTINHVGAGEVSHMFFAKGARSIWASHPPLEERIRRIDPNWDGVFPEVRPLTDEREESPARKPPPRPGGLPTLPGMPQLPLPAVLGLSDGDKPPAAAAATDEPLPDRLLEAIEEPFMARAIIYALLLDPDEPVRGKQLASLSAQAEPKDFTATKKLEAAVQAVPEEARLSLTHRAMPTLRQMSPRQYQVFRGQVEQLIAADGRLSLFEFCLERVVLYHLDLAFHWRVPPRLRYKSPAPLADAIVPVLGLLAWKGAMKPNAGERADELVARKAFVDGFQQFLTGTPAPALPPREAIGLDEFGKALDRFSAAAPAVQQTFLQACLACIMSDGVVAPHEKELLRAICSTLRCPMPVIESTVKPSVA